MTRLHAFLLHLAISVAVIAVLFLVIFLIWYPPPLFTYEGAYAPLTILVIVDVILGPLLTLLLFKPGKKGLKFDITVIALVQVAALLYGGWTIWSQRPLAMVFAADRFFIVGAGDIHWEDAPAAIKKASPVSGPVTVYAKPVDDPDYLLAILLNNAPDIHLLPARYQPIDAHRDAVLARAISLDQLITHSPVARDFFRQHHPELSAAASDYGVLPLHGRIQSGAVLVDRRHGAILTYLDLDVSALMKAIKARARLNPPAPETPTPADAHDDDATRPATPPAHALP